ncbi:acetate--CoA ligase [Bacillus sp. 31A1R]|uniref:acetate--CoA ligase n=1 Tax=Robertmurraya mangrovi TaxID=3098077 RepID=A0ABU5ITK6_9BACI|nr:acetate--CoA ligase [Bacillus sp. 31A1R]MDZ5470466.1 acetate--CoA ligase [Bacillus sp. 31A1R]
MTNKFIHLPPTEGEYQLSHYEGTRDVFSWESVHAQFSWNKTGKVNMAYECIDRHVDDGYGDKTALIYIEGTKREELTFHELKKRTDQLAALLKSRGVKKGDRVFVFLTKHPDCYVAVLASIKIGAIVGPLFEAFMEEAIYDRMYDCEASVLITNSELLERVPVNKLPHLKSIYITDESEDESLLSIPKLTSNDTEIADVIEWVDLNDGMIIHYTSGSTGKPKGVLHAHRVMVQQYQTGKWVLDLRDDDIYWCTAHPGWVTGSSYGIFAPWLNRATIVVHGGRFAAEEWFDVIEQAGVTVWYSAPTAFRLLMDKTELVKNYNLSSLRHILSVGEPLNPEVITWGVETLNLRIHDTWWMTETGGQLIVNLPSQTIKPGSMGRPLPGIQAAIIDHQGNELKRGELGLLAIKKGWPSMMKEIWKNEEKYHSYFIHDWYLSGDLAYMDEEGYVFFQGRDDDMINSSGERIGPFEVESKLIEHPAVLEAAVIGKPDPVRGEIVKAFIVLVGGYTDNPKLKKEIQTFVRYKLSAHSMPREIEVLDELPKTQISGKILRRELKRKEIEKLVVN